MRILCIQWSFSVLYNVELSRPETITENFPKVKFFSKTKGFQKAASSPGRPAAFCVCRARHVILKVSQMYTITIHLTSLRPSLMEAKGVAVVQRGTGDGASEGSRLAEARYRESTG